MFGIRKRLALGLCRAAGLGDVATRREEMDDLRDSNRKLAAAYTAQLQLIKSIAVQTNSNTLMLKRWHDGSPALQTIEKAASTRGERKSKLILPPLADLRIK